MKHGKPDRVYGARTLHVRAAMFYVLQAVECNRDMACKAKSGGEGSKTEGAHIWKRAKERRI
eukprot:7403205-Prorocentrum_lima.AAC.1